MKYFSIEMVLGGIFLFSGVLLKFYPPKTINAFYGYRTHLSMKNLTNWEAGNKILAKLFMFGGGLSLLTDFFLLNIIPSNVATRILVGISLAIIIPILSIIVIERKLKEIDSIKS